MTVQKPKGLMSILTNKKPENLLETLPEDK